MIDILQATDRCVMCGMCLPHCPTYGKTRHEADSPRGRIALMRALDTGSLSGEGALVRHLDGCLGCRACEAVCPTGVPYGELIDATRERLMAHRQGRFDARALLVDFCMKRRWPRRLAYWLLFGYQRLGAQKVTRKSGVLKRTRLARAESLLPRLDNRPVRLPTEKPAKTGDANVALFTGCAAELFDRPTLAASQEVLTRFGYNVRIPRRQTCCGALHQHDGAAPKAVDLMKRNIHAFDQSDIEAVISTATGCGAQLAEYPKHVNGETAQRLSDRHTDICRFLAMQEWPISLKLKPLAARVAVHAPCSQSHVLKQSGHAAALLARIPGINLAELPDNARCCGAAGSYMLREPGMADDLLADKIEHLRILHPDIVVTSNIGCALHLRAGLRRAGLDVQVMHPVALLNQQLEAA